MFDFIIKAYNSYPLKNLLRPLKKTFLFKKFRDYILEGLNNESNRRTSATNIRNFIRLVRPIQTEFSLIRIGGNNDGGYLIPDDLSGVKYCFSPGVGNQISFDLDLADRGIQCFLADGSINHTPSEHHLISFQKKYIDIKNTDTCISIPSWIKAKAPNKEDFIMQMDIEGAEYRILQDINIKHLKKFRILVVEFHGLDQIIYDRRFKIISSVFKKLTTLFSVVHIHPNNDVPVFLHNDIKIPPVMEFTFILKKRVKKIKFVEQFPHVLDEVNNPKKMDFALPECWYKSNETV